jgi:hypothetical protein
MDIDEFFKRVIDGYLLHDLKNMNEVKQKKGEPAGALGYPMLATTASAIELLGGILQTDKLYNDKITSSRVYFEYYWKKYLANVDSRYDDKIEIFWKLIRHGVAHTYFTKVGITVTKRKPSKHLLPTQSGLNVDCSTFYKDFLKTYNQAKKVLKDVQYKDKVQANINELFRLSSGKSEPYSRALYFGREMPDVSLSGTIFEPSKSTYTAIPPDIMKSLREQALSNTIRASGASIARPVDDIKSIKTDNNTSSLS